MIGKVDDHLDFSSELGAVGDDDAGRSDVAVDSGSLGDRDRSAGDDVSDHLTMDFDAVDFDVGLEDAGLGNREVSGQGDASFEATFDDEVFFANERAADGDLGAEMTGSGGGVRHVFGEGFWGARMPRRRTLATRSFGGQARPNPAIAAFAEFGNRTAMAESVGSVSFSATCPTSLAVSASPDPKPPLDRAGMIEWFSRFERPDRHLIGTEQEKFGLAFDGDDPPSPVTWDRHVRPMLEGMISRFGWKPGSDKGTNGEVVALERDGASITLEPAGQFELSGAPLETLHQTCAEFTQHYNEVHELATELNIAFITSGFHPWARRDELDWMPKGRYAVMRNYLPTKGERALDMMTRTCTVQANFDYASEKECAWRFKLAMGISPLLTAIFANSPYIEGESNGIASNRSEVWESVDPDRCGLLPFIFDGEGLTYERYVDYVLDVPMFFIKRGSGYVALHIPFRTFLAEGFTGPDGQHHTATWKDWELHLSTVFPEVRIKPFIEIRCPDSVGSRYLCAMPAICKGLMYDEDSGRAAYEPVANLTMAERYDLWRVARREGLRNERVHAMAKSCLELARQGLDRIDERDEKGRTEARFLDPLDELIEQRLSPGDLRLQELGPKPGRSAEARRNFVRAFHFAGVGGPEAE